MIPVYVAQLGMILAVFGMLLLSAAVMVYSERKVAAFIQQRYGPYLVGPRGLLQPIADVIKLMFKEPLRPVAADKAIFFLAPILSATAAFADRIGARTKMTLSAATGLSDSLKISLITSAIGCSRPLGPTR